MEVFQSFFDAWGTVTLPTIVKANVTLFVVPIVKSKEAAASIRLRLTHSDVDETDRKLGADLW